MIAGSTRRTWALPLVPLYASAVAVKDHLYNRGLLRPRNLQAPVVSIGSLSAGGAGKTPAVLLLAEMLQQLDYAPDILTRGYGRQSTATERVILSNDPNIADPSRFGDEPILLAQRSGLPVFVGPNRHASGLVAESTSPTHPNRIHLLDDGFQHRRLARTVDIVLLTAADLADRLLPAGNLREPLSALARADIVLLREDEPNLTPDFVGDLISAVSHPSPRRRTRPHPPAVVWIARRTLTLPILAATSRSIAFCGIARPAGFLNMLASAGSPPVAHKAFPDHHLYTHADIGRLRNLARTHDANAFLTTEKDAVKLTPAMRAELGHHGPLLTARLDLDFADETPRKQALDDLTRLLKR